MSTSVRNKDKVKIETRTKIVCTLGPASESETTLKQMMDAGMDVARINCAHGSYEEYKKRIGTLRTLSDKIAVLVDLAGPKIRVGEMAQNVFLQENSEIVLTTKKIVGNEQTIPQSYEELPCRVKKGDTIFIDEGLIQLEVLSIPNEEEIVNRVVKGGPLRSKRGINVPGAPLLRIPTPKDYKDIRTGIELGADYFGISFVKSREDVERIKEIISDHGEEIPVISKIETVEATEQFDEILQVSDGIMVARGDLGVELLPEKVPLIQKKLIKKCNIVGIPVIVATQMLESMIEKPRPTRAEASDVANAVLDGADAIMLSGETAVGRYPVQAVKVMDQIASIAEKAIPRTYQSESEAQSVAEVIGECVNLAVDRQIINAVIVSTKTGFSCRMISKLRPKAPIIATTPFKSIYRRSSLVWGVTPLLMKEMSNSTDERVYHSIKAAVEKGLINHDDTIAYVAGSLLGTAIMTETNLFQIYKVATVLDSVKVIQRFD
ncbi:MAG: pyruvate kinase [Candidatus Heimdallarchaeota archaeon]